LPSSIIDVAVAKITVNSLVNVFKHQETSIMSNRVVSPQPNIPKSYPVNEDVLEDVFVHVPEIEVLFDAGQAEETRPRSLISSAITAIAEAYQAASRFVAGVINKLRPEKKIEDIKVGSPTDVKKLELPEDLRNGLNQLEADKAKVLEKNNFIQSIDSVDEPVADLPDPDKQAFDSYVSLCRVMGKEPGTELCSVNFREGATRYAEQFIRLVGERKDYAAKTNQEFWLSPEDQARLTAADKFLQNHGDNHQRKLAATLDVATPAPQTSSNQLLSFNAWRLWKSADNDTKPQAGLSVSAAVVYAKHLLNTFAGKELAATDQQIAALVRDAYDLILNQETYELTFGGLCSAATMLADFGDVRNDSANGSFAAHPDAGQPVDEGNAVGILDMPEKLIDLPAQPIRNAAYSASNVAASENAQTPLEPSPSERATNTSSSTVGESGSSVARTGITAPKIPEGRETGGGGGTARTVSQPQI